MLGWERVHNPKRGSRDETMTTALCWVITNLISLSVLTHKRLIIVGECWRVVVDVQDSDVYRHPADLSRVGWETQRWTQ